MGAILSKGHFSLVALMLAYHLYHKQKQSQYLTGRLNRKTITFVQSNHQQPNNKNKSSDVTTAAGASVVRSDFDVSEVDFAKNFINLVCIMCPRRMATSPDERRCQELTKEKFDQCGLHCRWHYFQFNTSLYQNLALHFGIASLVSRCSKFATTPQQKVFCSCGHLLVAFS